MSRHTDHNKAMARLAGLDVREDADQPGRYVWVQTSSDGATVDGCDSSFPREDEAWDEVVSQVVGETMASFDLSDEQWDALDPQAQENLVRRTFLDDAADTRPARPAMAP